MAAEPAGGVRELRLEGLGLGLAVFVLAGLLGTAFWLGRRFERATGTTPPFAATIGAPGAATPPPVDVSREATHFDRVGAGQPAEPGREARSVAPPTPGNAGDYWVQVFAGRDQATADALVERLRTAGHAVVLRSERDGEGALFKVRVGGFDREQDARLAATRLEREGHRGAWVTRAPR